MDSFMVGSIEVPWAGGLHLPFRVGQVRAVSGKSEEFENLTLEYNMLFFEKNMVEEENKELQSTISRLEVGINDLRAQKNHYEMLWRKNEEKLAERYQTKTCKFWAMNVPCPYQSECTYAHAHVEPAPSPKRCTYFAAGQVCPNGAGCRYRHE